MVSGCHLQVPGQTSKNALFAEVQRLDFTRKGEDSSVEFKLEKCALFVAKQIDQRSRYYLFQVDNTAFQQSQGTQKVSVEQVKLTFNENYILFLAALFEHHLNETKQLVEFA